MDVDRPGPGAPLAIFDLDGTLIDSLDDIAVSLNHALVAVSLPTRTRAEVATMVGDGMQALIERASVEYGAERVGDVLTHFAAHYRDHCVDQTRVYAGLDACLDRLVDAGWQLAVLSNKPQAFTETCCTQLLSRWSWVAVAGAREGVPKKPDPSAALAIASEAGCPPERCCFVGDTVTDVTTAQRAGMVAVAVTWGFRPREVLADARPDLLIDGPTGLAEALLAHPARSAG